MLFWTTVDLENKLLDFGTYFNNQRTHTAREGRTPDPSVSRPIANLRSSRWQPIADPYIRRQWLPDCSETRAHCASGQPPQKAGIKSSGVCVLGCSAFRGSDRFTATVSIRQRQASVSPATSHHCTPSGLVVIRKESAHSNRLYGWPKCKAELKRHTSRFSASRIFHADEVKFLPFVFRSRSQLRLGGDSLVRVIALISL
jgi:hypothetical protein